MLPVVSRSRRRSSKPANIFRRSRNRSGVSPSAKLSWIVPCFPLLASSTFISGSSSRSNILDMSGRNGASDGPRNPGRALFRTIGRPCIRSTNAGTGSSAVPSNFPRTQPTAGRPPTDASSLARNPDWHWKASCSPAEPTSERRNANLSAIPAIFGINSVTWKPGSLVAIGLNSPRISSGASGFGSMVSSCGGPPSRWMLMIDLTDDFTPPAASARKRSASVQAPTAPATRALRRFGRGAERMLSTGKAQRGWGWRVGW